MMRIYDNVKLTLSFLVKWDFVFLCVFFFLAFLLLKLLSFLLNEHLEMSSLNIKLKSFKGIFNLLSKKGVTLRLLVLNS